MPEAAKPAMEGEASKDADATQTASGGSAAPAGAQPAPKAAAKADTDIVRKIVVKNLPEDSTNDSVRAMFEAHGTVQHTEVKCKTDGKCRGFGFITFSSEDEAKAAIAAKHDTDCEDKKLIVLPVQADPKGKGKDGKDGKGKGKDGKGKSKDGKGKDSWGKDGWGKDGWSFDKGKGKSKGGKNPIAQAMNTYMYGGGYPNAYYHQYAAAAAYQYAAAAATQQQGANAGMAVIAAAMSGTREYEGSLRSLSGKNGYGFIVCQETFNLFQRDVYVGREVMPEGAKVLDRLKFKVTTNEKGHPKATFATVVRLDGSK